MSKKSDDEEQPLSSAVLSKRSRIAASAAAVVLAIAGLTAVFLSTNQAGTALVIAASALFGVMGLSGQLPAKLKFGDNEITLPIVQAVSKKIESASPREAGELAERVIQALPRSGLHSRHPGLLYERMVRSVILQLESEGSPYVLGETDWDTPFADICLRDTGSGRSGRTIDVDVRYFNVTNPVPLSSVKKFHEFLKRSRVVLVDSMMITNAYLDPKGKELLEAARSERSSICVVSAGSRDEMLDQLRAILAPRPEKSDG